MICKTCGNSIIQSDIILDYCIECFPVSETMEPYKSNDFECFCCGEIFKSLTNDMCNSCYKEWLDLSDNDRDEIIRLSWSRNKINK